MSSPGLHITGVKFMDLDIFFMKTLLVVLVWIVLNQHG